MKKQPNKQNNIFISRYLEGSRVCVYVIVSFHIDQDTPAWANGFGNTGGFSSLINQIYGLVFIKKMIDKRSHLHPNLNFMQVKMSIKTLQQLYGIKFVIMLLKGYLTNIKCCHHFCLF